jgi:hypothetical protein
MGTTNEHGMLITAAAKAALLPLGCKQIGRSRTWISDQGFWVVQIEFQPSGWSKGSYLNVSPIWLWLRMGDGRGNRRVANFISYERVDQFTPLVIGMAARAAEEVLTLRQKFRSLSDVYRDFMSRITGEGFPIYRAAITAGLIGDVATAHQLFRRIACWATDGYDWQSRMKTESAALADKLDDAALFRSAVDAVVQERRARFKLGEAPEALSAAGAISG